MSIERTLTAGYGIRITPHEQDYDSIMDFLENYFDEVCENTPFTLVDIQNYWTGDSNGFLIMRRNGLVHGSTRGLECFLEGFPLQVEQTSEDAKELEAGFKVVRKFATLDHEDWRVYVGQTIH